MIEDSKQFISEAWLREIGAMLRSHRKARKMTQEDLAKVIGVDRSYISKVEHGEQNMYISTLGCICSALGLTIDIHTPKGYSNKKR